ncbi:MAG: InlB B-repeat-containing protein, partial [Eubacteriales bacterium]|nr:InlB B-repeat-containing protein [Eubacteriales bacterium]
TQTQTQTTTTNNKILQNLLDLLEDEEDETADILIVTTVSNSIKVDASEITYEASVTGEAPVDVFSNEQYAEVIRAELDYDYLQEEIQKALPQALLDDISSSKYSTSISDDLLSALEDANEASTSNTKSNEDELITIEVTPADPIISDIVKWTPGNTTACARCGQDTCNGTQHSTNNISHANITTTELSNTTYGTQTLTPPTVGYHFRANTSITGTLTISPTTTTQDLVINLNGHDLTFQGDGRINYTGTGTLYIVNSSNTGASVGGDGTARSETVFTSQGSIQMYGVISFNNFTFEDDLSSIEKGGIAAAYGANSLNYIEGQDENNTIRFVSNTLYDTGVLYVKEAAHIGLARIKFDNNAINHGGLLHGNVSWTTANTSPIYIREIYAIYNDFNPYLTAANYGGALVNLIFNRAAQSRNVYIVGNSFADNTLSDGGQNFITLNFGNGTSTYANRPKIYIGGSDTPVTNLMPLVNMDSKNANGTLGANLIYNNTSQPGNKQIIKSLGTNQTSANGMLIRAENSNANGVGAIEVNVKGRNRIHDNEFDSSVFKFDVPYGVVNIDTVDQALALSDDDIYSKNIAKNGYGGVFHIQNADSITINQGKYLENEAMYGGAICITDCKTLTTNVDNNATLQSDATQIHNLIFGEKDKENKASIGGGALYIRKSKVELIDVQITDNKAEGEWTSTYSTAVIKTGVGGHIYFESDEDTDYLKLSQSNDEDVTMTLQNGFAYAGGGAIYAKGTSKDIAKRPYIEFTETKKATRNTLVQNNEANSFGGAIALDDVAFKTETTEFKENISKIGGAIFVYASGSKTLSNERKLLDLNSTIILDSNLSKAKKIENMTEADEEAQIGGAISIYAQSTNTDPARIFGINKTTISNTTNAVYMMGGTFVATASNIAGAKRGYYALGYSSQYPVALKMQDTQIKGNLFNQKPEVIDYDLGTNVSQPQTIKEALISIGGKTQIFNNTFSNAQDTYARDVLLWENTSIRGEKLEPESHVGLFFEDKNFDQTGQAYKAYSINDSHKINNYVIANWYSEEYDGDIHKDYYTKGVVANYSFFSNVDKYTIAKDGGVSGTNQTSERLYLMKKEDTISFKFDTSLGSHSQITINGDVEQVFANRIQAHKTFEHYIDMPYNNPELASSAKVIDYVQYARLNGATNYSYKVWNFNQEKRTAAVIDTITPEYFETNPDARTLYPIIADYTRNLKACGCANDTACNHGEGLDEQHPNEDTWLRVNHVSQLNYLEEKTENGNTVNVGYPAFLATSVQINNEDTRVMTNNPNLSLDLYGNNLYINTTTGTDPDFEVNNFPTDNTNNSKVQGNFFISSKVLNISTNSNTQVDAPTDVFGNTSSIISKIIYKGGTSRTISLFRGRGREDDIGKTLLFLQNISIEEFKGSSPLFYIADSDDVRCQMFTNNVEITNNDMNNNIISAHTLTMKNTKIVSNKTTARLINTFFPSGASRLSERQAILASTVIAKNEHKESLQSSFYYGLLNFGETNVSFLYRNDIVDNTAYTYVLTEEDTRYRYSVVMEELTIASNTILNKNYNDDLTAAAYIRSQIHLRKDKVIINNNKYNGQTDQVHDLLLKVGYGITDPRIIVENGELWDAYNSKIKVAYYKYDSNGVLKRYAYDTTPLLRYWASSSIASFGDAILDVSKIVVAGKGNDKDAAVYKRGDELWLGKEYAKVYIKTDDDEVTHYTQNIAKNYETELDYKEVIRSSTAITRWWAPAVYNENIEEFYPSLRGVKLLITTHSNIWAAVATYTIIYDVNTPSSPLDVDGTSHNPHTGFMKNFEVLWRSSPSISTNNYAIAGYTFIGWKLSSASNNADILNNTTLPWKFSKKSTETTILYAHWQANTYSIIYNLNDQVGSSRAKWNDKVKIATPKIATFDSMFGELPTASAIERYGYLFLGWATKANANGTSAVRASEPIIYPDYIYRTTYNQTIYAVWQPNHYKLTYDINDRGTTIATIATTYKIQVFDDTYYPLATASKKGYLFKGWAHASYGDIVIPKDRDLIPVVTPAETYKFTSDSTVYAIWREANYNVTVYSKGGEIYLPNGQTVKEYSYQSTFDWPYSYDYDTHTTYSHILPTAATIKRKGWTLLGWSAYDYSSPGEVKKEDFIQNETKYFYASDSGLYPIWDQTYYDMYLDGNGGYFYELKWRTVTVVIKGYVVTYKVPYTIATPTFIHKVLYTVPIGTMQEAFKKGYTFDHFYRGTGSDATSKSIVLPTTEYWYDHGDRVYARWTPNTYSILYLNGDKEAQGKMATTTAIYDEELYLATNSYTIEGMTFEYWSDPYYYHAFNEIEEGNQKPDGIKATYADIEKVKNIRNNLYHTATLTAIWKENPYTIIFDPNTPPEVIPGVKNVVYGTMANLQTTYRKVTKLPKSSFSAPGYTFGGWSLDPNALGRDFANEATVSRLVTSGSITLYAFWGRTEFYMYFDVNQGVGNTKASLSFASKSVIYGEELGDLPTGTRYGYYLHGFASLSYATYTVTMKKEVPVIHSTDLYKNIDDTTYYSIWINNAYTVTFDERGGVPLTTKSKTVYYELYYGEGEDLPTVQVDPSHRGGFSFYGWSTRSYPDASWSYAYKNRVENWTQYTLTTDSTLYAIWGPIRYYVNFEANGGDYTYYVRLRNGAIYYDLKYTTTSYAQYQEQDKPIGEFISELGETVNAKRTGYTFVGWTTSSDIYATDVKIYKKPSEYDLAKDATLYTRWEANKYTIVFDKNDLFAVGTMSNINMIYDTEAVITTCSFTLEGLTFLYYENSDYKVATDWGPGAKATYSNGEVIKNIRTTSGSTVVLKAIWSDSNVAIRYNVNTPAAVRKGYENTYTGTMSITVTKYRASVSLAKIAYKVPGYDFVGWMTNKATTVIAFHDEQEVSKLQAGGYFDLYASWSKAVFNINFDTNDFVGTTTGSLTFNNKKVVYDTPYGELPTGNREGYNLLGFATHSYATYTYAQKLKLKEVDTTSIDTLSTIINTNQLYRIPTNSKLYAIWLNNIYKINYNIKTGTLSHYVNNNDPEETKQNTYKYLSSRSVVFDAPFNYDLINDDYKNTFLSPKKNGYSLEGWLREDYNINLITSMSYIDELAKKIVKASDSFASSNDITLYALWRANKYTITYNAAYYNTAQNKGQFVAWRPNYPKKTTLSVSYKGTTYSIVITEWVDQAFDTITVPAIYNTKLATYFNVTNGFKDVLPFYKGHHFTGWLDDPSANAKLASGAYITKETTFSITENATVIPEIKPNEYQIKINHNLEESLALNELQIIFPATEVETYVDISGNTQSITYKPGVKYLYKDLMNTKVFTKYTLVDHTFAGYQDNVIQIPYGIFYREGYNYTQFVDTNYDIKASKSYSTYRRPSYTPGQKAGDISFEEDIYLVPNWRENTYSIIFDANAPESKDVSKQNVAKGTMSVLTIPYSTTTNLTKNNYTIKGYTFTGWAKDKTSTNVEYVDEATISKVISSNSITFYALWMRNTYSLAFDKNDTFTSKEATLEFSSMSVTYDEYTSRLPLATMSGYKLLGFASVSGASLSAAKKKTLNPASKSFVYREDKDSTYYAIWENEQYTLNYNLKKGTLSEPLSRQITFDEKFAYDFDKDDYTATFANPTKLGYTFKGWVRNDYEDIKDEYKPNTESRVSVNEIYASLSDLTLYATWEPNAWVLTLSAEGETDRAGTVVGEFTEIVAVKKSTEVEIGGKKYTVQYTEMEEVKSATVSKTVYYDYKLATLSSPKLIGYTFDNYRDKVGGRNTTPSITKDYHYEWDQDYLLNAYWKENTYSITFEKGDSNATGTMSEINSVYYNDIFDLPTNNFENAGFDFHYWKDTTYEQDKKDGKLGENAKATYSDGEVGLSKLRGLANGRIVLEAVWGDKEYTVHFVPNTPSSLKAGANNQYKGTMSDAKYMYYSTGSLPKNNFEIVGYTFDGWAKTPTGNVVFKDEEEVYKLSTKSISLYAIWSNNIYTVNYDVNDSKTNGTTTGTLLDATKSVSFDKQYGSFTIGTRSGYTLLGFSTISNATKSPAQKLNIDLISEEDIYRDANDTTIYAIWGNNEYVINYDTKGGVASNSISTGSVIFDKQFNYDITNDTNTKKFLEPTKNGYTYRGWLKEDYDLNLLFDEKEFNKLLNKVISEDNYYATPSDITLYALWEPNIYELTYTTDAGDITRWELVQEEIEIHGKLQKVWVEKPIQYKTVTGLKVKFDTPIATIYETSRLGYTLLGFEDLTKALASGNIINKNTIYDVASNSVVTASWSANTYYIEYLKGDEKAIGTMATDSMTYDEEAT